MPCRRFGSQSRLPVSAVMSERDSSCWGVTSEGVSQRRNAGMVAEIERSFIRERQKAGIERAKSNGVYRACRAGSSNAQGSIQLRSSYWCTAEKNTQSNRDMCSPLMGRSLHVKTQ